MKIKNHMNNYNSQSRRPLRITLLISYPMILLILGNLYAQIDATVEISSWHDDNLYRSPEKVEDVVTNFDFQLEYQPDESDANLYFNGSYLMYSELRNRNFYMNALGFNFIKSIDSNELHTFYLGIDWTFRINNEDFNYYDYHQLYAYNNLSFNFDWIYVRGGYNYRYRNYKNIPDLNNHQIYGFLQLNKSFETRTTIILESDLGYKSFAGQDYSITDSISGSGGRGHGNYSGTSATTVTSSSVSEIPSLSQAVFLARIAQSLYTKMGIYVQYRKQVSLIDETSYINSDDYYQDEELFDDPFSYESQSYSSQLTWILPWQIKLQLGGNITEKDYISEVAYTSIDDTTGMAGIRADDQNSYFAYFIKTFYLNKEWINSIQFNINYSYIRNESNSYWYNYENALISGNIRLMF